MGKTWNNSEIGETVRNIVSQSIEVKNLGFGQHFDGTFDHNLVSTGKIEVSINKEVLERLLLETFGKFYETKIDSLIKVYVENLNLPKLS